VQERVIHPAVSAAMIELLKARLIWNRHGGRAQERTVPGMDPLGNEI
jgi:hypothetical protein